MKILHITYQLVGDNTKEIVLAHLSQDNNTPVIAYEMLNDHLEKENQKMVENNSC